MPDIAALPVESPPVLVEIADRPEGERFWPIAEIRDPDGVVAVITERVSDGRISFSMFREYEQDGTTKRSAYLAHRHIPGQRRLLAELDRRLEGIEDRSRAARRMAR